MLRAMRADAAFLALLAPFDVAQLDDEPSTIYALDAELRIRYVNRAWGAFARENGAAWSADEWGLGSPALAAVPEVLRAFYAGLFERALASGAPVEHEYECSSPEKYRRFCMRVIPCRGGSLLVVHSLAQENPHPAAREESPAIDALYRDAHGLVTQCSHCRRVRRPDTAPERWDSALAYVERVSPTVSHGLCTLCLQYYYPE